MAPNIIDSIFGEVQCVTVHRRKKTDFFGVFIFCIFICIFICIFLLLQEDYTQGFTESLSPKGDKDVVNPQESLFQRLL